MSLARQGMRFFVGVDTVFTYLLKWDKIIKRKKKAQRRGVSKEEAMNLPAE